MIQDLSILNTIWAGEHLFDNTHRRIRITQLPGEFTLASYRRHPADDNVK